MKTCSLLMAGAVAAVLGSVVATGSQPGGAAPTLTGQPAPPPVPPAAPDDGAKAAASTPLFQADTSAKPTVTVSWPRRDGTVATYTSQREYTAPEQRGSLAPNLTTYVALGGTRGEAGAADPRAAIVKVGFYKVDANKPFFDGIADGAAVTVTVTNVRFTRPARPEPQTVLQHGKYEDPNSVLGCTSSQAVSTAMGGLDFYNTVDANDDLAGKITPKNGRLGSLAGLSSSRVEADGSVTWTMTLPYAGLKHPDDPWLRTNPGDFAEPFHFHVEMEVLPADAGPRQQGTSPAKAQTPA
jgi:hypothetical protein